MAGRPVSPTEDLLRRLCTYDERYLQAARWPEVQAGVGGATTLSRRTRALVELAALLAVDAETTSLRWAAERAAVAGADDQALVRVLLASASAAGSAQTASGAARLALALDLDVAAERAPLLSEQSGF